MSAVSSEDKNKRATRFDPPGINYKAKLIGLEDVTEPRGDKMCQVGMAKLKAAVVAMGEHKPRITVNISLEGIKIIDEKTENILHSHPVHRISFISRDTNDSRAFGYVYNREDGIHQFCGIKTEKAAEPLVTCLRDLFQTVVELKKEKEKENAKNENATKNENAVKNENAANAVTTEEKDKEKEVELENKIPVSTDLLGLDGSVTGLQQGMDQLNVFSPQPTSNNSNAWLNVNMFQNVPALNLASQAGALHIPQAAAITGSPFLPPGSQPIALYQRPPYPQQPFTSYNPSLQNPAGLAAAGAVGLHPAWPQSRPPAANLQGPGIELQTSNPSWMSFDSSTQLSNMFGDLSSPVSAPQTGSSANNAFSAVPIQPTSIHPASDPFAPAAKFPDPFADLAVLPSQAAFQPGKKVSKEDFIKEPPKPTLLDLSQQQHQQTGTDLITTATDPFATVSPPKNGSLFRSNPFQQEVQNFHSTSLAPRSALRTVDKSCAIFPSAQQDFATPNVSSSESLNTQFFGDTELFQSPARPEFADHPQSQASRPRPRSNAGAKAGFVLPLTPKVKPSILCTKPFKKLHDEMLLPSNIRHATSVCKTMQDNLPVNDINQPINQDLPLTYLQGCGSAGDSAKSFDELWLLSVAHRIGFNSSEESIWCSASIDNQSDKILTLENTAQDKNCNFFGICVDKQNLTTTTDNQKLGMAESHVQNFENCSTSIENLTNRWGPDVALTEKESFLKVSGTDLRTDPDKTNVSISEDDNIPQSKKLQSTLCSARNNLEKLTLASLARKSSARRTCSLKGLVTIREENDSYACHSSLRPVLSANGNGNSNKNFLQTPSFLTKFISKYEINAETSSSNNSKVASSETYLKINPFAGVDPFVTDTFILGDPFDNQNGLPISTDDCALFDVLQEDSKPFCTRAVTVDFNTKKGLIDYFK